MRSAPRAMLVIALSFVPTAAASPQDAGPTAIGSDAHRFDMVLDGRLESNYAHALARNGGQLPVDPNGRAISSTAAKGLIMARDKVAEQYEEYADKLEADRDAGVQDKYSHLGDLARESSDLARDVRELKNERHRLFGEDRLDPNPNYEEELKAIEEEIDQRRIETFRQYPELAVRKDGTELWEALAAGDWEGDLAGLANLNDIYNTYLDYGAATLRTKALETRQTWDWEGLFEYGSERYSNAHQALELEGELVGSTLPGQFMNTITGNYDAYEAEEAVEDAWWQVGILAASAIAIPIGAVACAGVGAVEVVRAGDELVVRYLDVEEAAATQTVNGARYTFDAEDKQDAASGEFAFAVLTVGVDVLEGVRAVRMVPPKRCASAADDLADARPVTGADEATRPSSGDAPDPNATQELPPPDLPPDEAVPPSRPTGDQTQELPPPDMPPDPNATQELAPPDLPPDEVADVSRPTTGDATEQLSPPDLPPTMDPELEAWYKRQSETIERLEGEIERFRERGFEVDDLERDLERLRNEQPPAHLTGGESDAFVDTDVEDLETARETARRTGMSEEEIQAIETENPGDPASALTREALQREGHTFVDGAPPDTRRLAEIMTGASRNEGRLSPEDVQWLEEMGGLDYIEKLKKRWFRYKSAEARPEPGREYGAEYEQVLGDAQADDLAEWYTRARTGDAAEAANPARADSPDRPRTGEAESPDPTPDPRPGGSSVAATVEGVEAAETGVDVQEDLEARSAEPATPETTEAPESGITRDSGPESAAMTGAGSSGDETAIAIGFDYATAVDPIDITLRPPRPQGEPTATSPDETGRIASEAPTTGDAPDEALSVGVDNAADVLNNDFVADASADDATQIMATVGRTVADVTDALSPFSAAPGEPLARLAYHATGRTSSDQPGGHGPGTGRWPGTGAVVDAAPPELLALLQRHDLAPDADGVTAFLTSLGGSTGQVFELVVVNGGDRPVEVDLSGVIVEPVQLGRRARRELEEQLGQLAARDPATARMVGYCMEFTKNPPTAGQLFRIASHELQERYAPLRDVMRVGQELYDAGLLNPDSDPESYAHSIVQWALWTELEDLDEDRFTESFLEHTRRNLEAAGRRWTDEIEDAVEALVPNRWQDIQRVLAETR